MTGVIEFKVRKLGKKNFVKFRNRVGGVIAYMPDGVTKRLFHDWAHAYIWILKVDETKELK